MHGGIVVPICQTVVATVVVSRVSKAIGEKEIGEIVTCVGIIAVGVLVIQGLTPLFHGMQEFSTNMSNGIQGFNNLLGKLMFWK